MAVAEGDSVHTVKTKRLKSEINIQEIKRVKCSPDNSYLLLAREDSTLHVLHVNTGEINFVCGEVKEFMWSKPKDPSTLNRSPTFAVLHHDGSVEVFDVTKKSVIRKPTEEESLTHVGLLTIANMKDLLKGEDLSLKLFRLIESRQVSLEDDEHADRVTLLFGGYIVLVLSFGLVASADVVNWCEIIKNVSGVPFLLPQQAIADVSVARDMLFILYQHGLIIVYDMTNWIFLGWIDVFQSGEQNFKDDIGQSSPKRPTAKILDVNVNGSTIIVCDGRNFVTKIDVVKYFECFPTNLEAKDSLTKAKGFGRNMEREKSRNMESEYSLCGDSVWKSEVLAITSKLDADSEKNTDKRSPRHLQDGDDLVVNTAWSVTISSPPWMKEFKVLDLYSSFDSFLLCLESNNTTESCDNHGVLCCWAAWKKEYLLNVFLERTLVASGGQTTKPLYLLTNKAIGVPVFDTTQNQLVNKLITYENVAMAEKLCYLNDWDHFAVPISALEAALKHGQLDTVAFYLRTKGKAFTTTANDMENANPVRALSPLSSSGSFISKQLHMKQSHSEELAEQIKAVVNLLIVTITASSKRKHSVQFTSQLLQMSFDYVNGLIQDAVCYIDREMGSKSDREQIQDILIYLTAKTMDLRSLQYGIPAFQSDGKERCEKDGEKSSSEMRDIVFENWSGMDDKDVIRDAILSCRVPLAQVYFLNESQFNTAHDGSLRYIMETGLRIVLEVLAKKDMATASEMIRNMGDDVVQLVRKICLKTFDRPLRNYLIEQLKSWGELSEEEIGSVEFIKSLESVYDSQSFESCQIRRSQEKQSKSFDNLGLHLRSLEPGSSHKKNPLVKTGSIAPQYQAAMISRVSGGYAEVLLDWVIAWDTVTRERILLEMLCHDEKAFHDMRSLVSERSLWQYLKAHCETTRIAEWIAVTAQGNGSSDLPPLTTETSNDLTECTTFVKELILDELTRNGLFSSTLLQDFPLLLRHLCRADTLFSKVHPLHDVTRTCGPSQGQEPGSEAVCSPQAFHKKMVKYCSDNDFTNLLYCYLDFYRLCQTSEECDELTSEDIHQDVDMLLKFRLVGIFPSDSSVISSMCFSNSKAIFRSDSSSLMEMLKNKRPIMAIATCLYAPVDLSKILNPSARHELDDIWQLDEKILKSSLSGYPRLSSALFPRAASHNLRDNPDITLYELLQGNCSFEVSGLFTWQTTNNLAAKGGAATDMPHFSHKPLVEKFGHKEVLTYVYFLKHGRPSFAYASFMSKYQYRKYIPRTSVLRATKKAYQLAISHFDNNRIVYSCVAFLELLSVDTTFLRIDVAAAKRCLHPGNKEELQCTTIEELKNAIVTKLLKSAVDMQEKPKVLVRILESSTKSIISKEGLDRTSREASEYWSLPILFCRSHNMTLTPVFLIDCAKADKWLTFLCHAQAVQFPKNQVLSIVQHHFESNTVKEHLHQALVNIVTVNIKDGGAPKRKAKTPTTRRNVRSQYLSRVMGASPVGKSEISAKSPEKFETPTTVAEAEEATTELDFGMENDLKLDEEDVSEDEHDLEMKNEVKEVKVTDLNPETSPDNLFDVLSLCNDVNEPWRAILAHSIILRRPLFAVLSACDINKEVKLVDCMCAWLCSVHNKETLHPVLDDITDIQWHKWTLDNLLALILTISKYGLEYVHSLTRVFYLFDPDNMLLPFMRFCEAFLIHMDFVAAGTQLSDFVVQHKSVSVNDSLQRQMVIGDLSWCERVSNGVVQNMLRSCETMFMQVQLLRLLCHSKFGIGFTIMVPDFKKLYMISQILDEGLVFAQCLDLTSDEAERSRVMEELIQRKQFSSARQYGTLLGISCDKVSVMQIINKKENIQDSRLWANEGDRIEFWQSCDRYFEEQGCTTAGQFFEDEAGAKTVSNREKATLLCLALRWFSGKRLQGKAATKSPDDLANLESEMWLCVINDRIYSTDEAKLKSSIKKFTCCESNSDLVQQRIVAVDQGFAPLIKDEKMRMVLKDILGELLDDGQITQARRIAQLFGVSTTDLDIVLTCIFLAQEILNPDSLDAEMKALFVHQDKPTLSNSLRSSGDDFLGSFSQSIQSSQSDSSASQEGIASWTVISDNLAAMKSLARSCKFGKICCARVIVAYKICQTLVLAFDKVVCSDPVEILCKLLESAVDHRFQLASQYIKKFNLDSTMIARFVAKSITMSLNVYTGSDTKGEKVFIFNPTSKDDMNGVTGLAEDKLVLGGFLFDEAVLFAKNRKHHKATSSALAMEVELLINAHNCQTMACNTEGISSILKLAQLCTHALAEGHEYQLMVRLLTGIGRFSEMTYIFQTLMDHHHFELLIKKGVDNESKLKIALLKYLDKHYFDDTEKHRLVAIRFNMYREVAVSLKSSADSQVNKLVRKGLGPNNEVRTQLVAIAQTYTYAMENFKEEGCLLQALECAKKHRLVELQKHLLPTGMVILDLNDKSLAEFLAKYNNFFEAYIVADAYNKRSGDVWVEPLFNHVILRGDFRYLDEICSVFQISNAILSELVQRYRSELQRNTTAILNMKKVMHCEKDIICRYKIAVELGYKDEVDAIRQSEAGALVRDTCELNPGPRSSNG
ncbi:spatacsin-like [Dendronephthya gigantea]|uniref:spatacsin-like n=1 Tax=Dendronephthya gigantea TaxID=151771 RepID=UPI00106A3313|nr:spatacsin-like [Dendronephthya gigantea]